MIDAPPAFTDRRRVAPTTAWWHVRRCDEPLPMRWLHVGVSRRVLR